MVRQLTEPVYPWLVDGTGTFAELIDIKTGMVNEDGIPEVELFIRPTKHFLEKYSISKYELDDNLCISKRFDANLIVELDKSPIHGVAILLCDWNGKSGPLMLLVGKHVIELKSLIRENNSLMAQVAYYSKMSTDMIVHLAKFDKAQAKRYREIFRLRGSFDNMISGEEGEGGQ